MEWEEKLIWNYSTTAVRDNPAQCTAHRIGHCAHGAVEIAQHRIFTRCQFSYGYITTPWPDVILLKSSHKANQTPALRILLSFLYLPMPNHSESL